MRIFGSAGGTAEGVTPWQLWDLGCVPKVLFPRREYWDLGFKKCVGGKGEWWDLGIYGGLVPIAWKGRDPVGFGVS